jgi:hypothetical protein
MDVHVARIHIKFVVGKPDDKGPLERLKRRWKDNIKVDLR